MVAPGQLDTGEEAGVRPRVDVSLARAVEGLGRVEVSAGVGVVLASRDLDTHGELEGEVLVSVGEAETAGLVVVAVVDAGGARRERRGHHEGVVVRRVHRVRAGELQGLVNAAGALVDVEVPPCLRWSGGRSAGNKEGSGTLQSKTITRVRDWGFRRALQRAEAADSTRLASSA